MVQELSETHADLLQGTLEMLILQTLDVDEPLQGWGVSLRIRERSRDVLRMNQGSLCPALHRLEHKGWIRSDWGTSENNRRAKSYRLTAPGRRRLEQERRPWKLFAGAVQRILYAT